MFYDSMISHVGGAGALEAGFSKPALGPWTVADHTDAALRHGLNELAIVRGGPVDTAEPVGSAFGRTAGEMQANANMIAAAPGMFFALEKVEAYVRSHIPESDLHELVISALEVAILGHAEGHQPHDGDAG